YGSGPALQGDDVPYQRRSSWNGRGLGDEPLVMAGMDAEGIVFEQDLNELVIQHAVLSSNALARPAPLLGAIHVRRIVHELVDRRFTLVIAWCRHANRVSLRVRRSIGQQYALAK